MKKQYITEIGWDVEIFDTKQEAKDSCWSYWNSMTDSEKRECEYCRAYEIEHDYDDFFEEHTGMYTDYLTEMICDYK